MFLTLADIAVRYRAPQRSGSPGPAAHAVARPAVDGVGLALEAGDIGVLIGPSGCGKTSLLRAVAGLEPLAGGRVELAGEALSDAATGVHLAPEARRIGMVFQDFALFPHLSVAENVGFGVAALPRTERRQRVQQMLDLVGLAHAAERAPHQLSGGQQQRVALARALAPQPRLLLLDEPFSSLDVDLRERLAQEVRAILKESGTTALMVTHDQLEAFAMADVVGVMNHGRLEQWGSPYELYHRPASRFVAGFIGHGVFAPAKVKVCNAGLCVYTPLGELHDHDTDYYREHGPHGLAEGQQVEVLLRADDIVHDDDSPVRARVERKAFRGSEFLYTLALESGQKVLALVPSHHDHPLGSWIGIRAEVDHVVTFDGERATAA